MQVQSGFLNRDVPFVDAVLRSSENEAALNRAAMFLHEVEERYGIAFAHAPGVIVGDWEPDEEWSRDVLQPFLEETHLLLTGEDCQ